ncbi:MAG: hypothetical protein UY48_C0002G0043 [Candidatus Gottesmanbacteria bacterium GW2011_GWB1_49_7]|uniref:Uncharacterized protein n=1 Tax=Candidatus Gottesmanbacteria bacterium GW2011_GWB1_49_7 TaxID=1618448 RepID=A0A0G1YEF5_9BACT|nr:MAG: hypothetical protein UY48_C0002G0043 [Candidatus Gottesmanbacteria bacterium GW2011_GWB1_49_7]
MSDSIQQGFNPADYCFQWTTDGWYEWDRKAAHKAALQARNARAKELRQRFAKVQCSTLPDQLITRGGIGSGRPEIDMGVSVYMVDARN